MTKKTTEEDPENEVCTCFYTECSLTLDGARSEQQGVLGRYLLLIGQHITCLSLDSGVPEVERGLSPKARRGMITATTEIYL